ncbi:MAG: DUF4132 domain-containing protein [Flavobacteriales bacterium]|nr:DUF4132 domain-containing protein [Bacteroidota bacterium]MCB9241914.1 DUF4132 domain-containing protein [Flavobacteriales bacterium]
MSLISRLFKKPDNVPAENKEFETIIVRSLNDYKRLEQYFYDVDVRKLDDYNQKVKVWDEKKKIDFIVYNFQVYIDPTYQKRSHNDEYTRRISRVREGYIKQLLRTKLNMDDSDACTLVNTISSVKQLEHSSLHVWPMSYMLNQIQNQFKDTPPSPNLNEALKRLRTKIDEISYYHYEKEKGKWMGKIDEILFDGGKEDMPIMPQKFMGNDDFSVHANHIIDQKTDDEKIHWYKLILLASSASGSKPTKKFLTESKALIQDLGNETFKTTVNDWLAFATALKEKDYTSTHNFDGEEYQFTTTEYISGANTESIKGFIWMCSHFHNTQTLTAIAALAERAYRKIPGKGPASAAIGNACIYVLYKSKGLEGIGHLSRLRLRIRQSNTQKLIEKYLHQAAEAQGVSISEIEDLSVDDYGLINGKKEVAFDDFTAVVEIERIGKITLKWLKADGSEQKSVPKHVTEKHKAKLKKLKDSIKQINLMLSAQRDRIDRMFRLNRSWAPDKFNAFYLDHGLMSFLTHRLIWNVTHSGVTKSVLFQDDEWKTLSNEVVSFDNADSISLWHPIQATVADIRQWRERIQALQMVQPLKQAFREVYILTDAEIKTKTYSNRMAAHILKQHQFNSLAKIRGWSYSLLGAYDHGMDKVYAELELPEYGLRAEYWINELYSDQDMNDTGIWNYIATDQVRFVKLENNDVMDLVDVPEIVLSEVLRDVDLFVGVASIGNDPMWVDSGTNPGYNDYWQSYSFGNLTEIAKTRKGILEGLIPRLKIRDVASIQDKFLVVKGKLRTYKIHIGSTNILMEPNDQYLCIVPDRCKKSGGEVFLPFEGDSGLSVILSKALMLADDTSITDTTITSQINRN